MSCGSAASVSAIGCQGEKEAKNKTKSRSSGGKSLVADGSRNRFSGDVVSACGFSFKITRSMSTRYSARDRAVLQMERKD